MKTDKDIDRAVRILKKETKRWPAPAVGNHAQTPFTVLISCILSLRTQDKTTDAASARLFALADRPETMQELPVKTIEKAIYPVGFYRTKARTIPEICRILVDRHGGRVPDAIDELIELPGVGRKTANLVVTVGYGKPGICVDTHVHRIANRWGYVRTKTPEETETALRKKLPRRHWIVLNDLLVTYGQNLCKPISPLCSRCLLRKDCARAGVAHSR